MPFDSTWLVVLDWKFNVDDMTIYTTTPIYVHSRVYPFLNRNFHNAVDCNQTQIQLIYKTTIAIPMGPVKLKNLN